MDAATNARVTGIMEHVRHNLLEMELCSNEIQQVVQSHIECISGFKNDIIETDDSHWTQFRMEVSEVVGTSRHGTFEKYEKYEKFRIYSRFKAQTHLTFFF